MRYSTLKQNLCKRDILLQEQLLGERNLKVNTLTVLDIFRRAPCTDGLASYPCKTIIWEFLVSEKQCRVSNIILPQKGMCLSSPKLAVLVFRQLRILIPAVSIVNSVSNLGVKDVKNKHQMKTSFENVYCFQRVY